MMSQIKLTSNNCLEQIVHYGFFAEQFPDCFSTDLLLTHLSELLPLISTSKSQKKNSKTNTTLQ